MKIKIHYTLIYLCILFPLILQNAQAENQYQHEITSSITDHSTDSGASTKLFVVAIQSFLKPIIGGDYPMAESAFVERQPYLAAAYARINREIFDEEINGNLYLLGGGYANNNFPIFVDIVYSKSKETAEINGDDLEQEFTTKEFNLGVYFTDFSAIKFTYGIQDAEASNGSRSSSGKRENFSASVKSLFKITNSNYLNLELEGNYNIDSDEDYVEDYKSKSYAAKADYYPSKSLGIGLGGEIFKSDNDISGAKSVKFRVRNFITPLVSVMLEFENVMLDDSDSDIQVFTFGFFVRL